MVQPKVDPYDMPSDEALGELPPDEQRQVIKDWFRANFENPAERTPYESAEGGYIYIWGGPYDTEEEVRERFEGIVPEEAIQDVVDDLNGEAFEWTVPPRRDDPFEDDADDDLPPDTSDEVRERYDELVAQHDRWLREHPLPTAEGELQAEVLRRLDKAEEALRILDAERLARWGDTPGKGHNNLPPDLVPAGTVPPDPPLRSDVARGAILSIEAARVGFASGGRNEALLRQATQGIGTAAKVVGLWVARNLNLAIQEFSKAFGKTLGVAAAGAVGVGGAITAFGDIRAAFAAVEHWLTTLLPF